MKNTLFLGAFKGLSPNSRPPVWLMRQAGRYLPQYQEFRKKHSLHDMFHDPVLASDVMISTVKILGVDAAIMFSDILVITEALGCHVDFIKTGGPVVSPKIRSFDAATHCPILDVHKTLQYVERNIQLLKCALDIPIIGFCGAPFTIGAYMIEDKPSHSLEQLFQLMDRSPQTVHTLLGKITQVTVEYLLMQIEAGAHSIQIFESWGHALTPQQFDQFALPYLKIIADALNKKNVPFIIFCKKTASYLDSLLSLMPSCISCDSDTDLAGLRNKIPDTVVIQGNLDPVFLKEKSVEEVRQKTLEMLGQIKGRSRYIANLGHGILPETPVQNVMAFIETVKSFTI